MIVKMKTFYEHLIDDLVEAGGASAGKLELVKTKLDVARKYAEALFGTYGRELDTELPNFDNGYKTAQRLAGSGTTKRKDMPVISDNDVKQLQNRLKSGSIDISAPFAKNNVPNDPFPNGLDTKIGDEWVVGGLKINDGDAKDDIVKVSMKKVAVGNLKPIQQQIYFDKSIANVAQFGSEGTRSFSGSANNTFVISSDNRIIDGHHRFLSAVLVDPSIKVNCLMIALPIAKLLPLTLSYSDAIGNKRNA